MRVAMKAILFALVAIGIAACAFVAAAGIDTGSFGRSIPVVFHDDRIVVVAPSIEQPELRFYADSGGGFNAIGQDVARRLALMEIGTIASGGDAAPLPLVAFPDVMIRAGIPSSHPDGPFKGGLVVVPPEQAAFFESEGNDGFLGGRWFDGHAWEIDYVHRTLRLLRDVTPVDTTHRFALGFQTDADGRRPTGFARVSIVVDGEPLQMLFDTGATATLATDASRVFDRPIGTAVGTSFITRSVFERWVARHPDWRVVAEGDRLGDHVSPMIEVSRITIAGLVAGPVWFAQRPDRTFHVFMASMMDAPVDGAIGGSSLHRFRVTIDYPAAVAYVELPRP